MIDDPEIDWLRGQIDAIDHQLLALVRQRLDVVLRVGERKREKGLAVYDPAREARLLESLGREATPPLDAEAITRIFTALVTECRRIESRHVED
ncbi:MAG TPA: chorismate mutase [Polyangiaceae bacterium]|nr:chorismate mutase [Polyangiaceae bacterium]